MGQLPVKHAPFYLHIPEDEIVFSTIARFALLGAYSPAQAMQDIYQNPRKRIHPYLPGKIRYFADFFELDVDHVIKSKTIYPLLSFSQPADVRYVREAMLNKSDDKVLLTTAIAHSRFKTFYGLNFCPLCTQEDIEKNGFAYWHISHQIPGVNTCSTHHCFLNSVLMGDGHNDRQLFLPPFEKMDEKYASDIEVKLATFTAQLFDLCRTQALNYQIIYRNILNQMGLVSPNDLFIEISKVISLLSEYWESLPYKNHLETGVPLALSNFQYIGRILRHKTHSHAHPLKHILLACWLTDGDINKLVSNSQKPRSKIDSSSNIMIAKKQAAEAEVIKLLRAGNSFNSIEGTTGKSRCFIKRVAETNRIPHLTNSMAFTDSVRRKVLIKALYGIHRELIAKELDLSIGYVEQVISCEPNMVRWRKHLRIRKSVMKAYKKLESICREHPDWCRTQVRKHAQSAYFVLYYNEKALIDKVLPKQIKAVAPSKDWEKEDLRIAEGIRNLGDLSSMSITEIGRLVNDHGYLRSKISKLPKSALLIIEQGKLNK